MNVGEKIRQRRKKQGLTMKQLGEIIGLSEQAISQYERNKRKPNLEIIFKLSSALNSEVIDFLDEDYIDILPNNIPLEKKDKIKILDDLLDKFSVKTTHLIADLCEEIIKQNNALYENYLDMFYSLPYEFNDITPVDNSELMIDKLFDDNLQSLIISLIRNRIKNIYYSPKSKYTNDEI